MDIEIIRESLSFREKEEKKDKYRPTDHRAVTEFKKMNTWLEDCKTGKTPENREISTPFTKTIALIGYEERALEKRTFKERTLEDALIRKHTVKEQVQEESFVS